MRFLADECCDFCFVKALRAEGHDVAMVRDAGPGADDALVVDLAMKDGRILLTEDKDFGQLVFAHGQGASGVIFLRYPYDVRETVSRELVSLTRRMGEGLVGCFVIVQPGRIRIGRLPIG